MVIQRRHLIPELVNKILFETLINRYECSGSSEMTIYTNDPCYSSCAPLKNPHFSTAMSAEQRSKFAAFHDGDVSIRVKN